MTTLEVLRAGRELISDPKRWTRRTLARDSGGVPTAPAGSDAVCWCSMGAIMRVAPSDRKLRAEVATVLSKFMDGLLTGGWLIGWWSDEHSHAEVIAAWDRAIAAEQSKSPEQGKE